MLVIRPSGECSTPAEVIDNVEVRNFASFVMFLLPYEEGELPDGEISAIVGGVCAEGYIKYVSKGSYLVSLKACASEDNLNLGSGPRAVSWSQGAYEATKVIIGGEHVVPFHFWLVQGEEV